MSHSRRASDEMAACTTVHSSVLVCSQTLVHMLNDQRIPPNFIGVGKVRVERQKNGDQNYCDDDDGDSNRTRMNAGSETNDDQSEIHSKHRKLYDNVNSIVYKVTNPDGTERRMTSQEKKAAKAKFAEEKKKTLEAKKKREREAQEEKKKFKTQLVSSEEDSSALEVEFRTRKRGLECGNGDDDVASDLKDGKPPVLLSPPMAVCAAPILLASDTYAHSTKDSDCYLQYDLSLSKLWAAKLKENMLPAEKVREGEDMRPMAYQLVPEMWARMLPKETFTSSPKMIKSSIHENSFHGMKNKIDTALTTPSGKPSTWAAVICRPPNYLDTMAGIVFDYLLKETPFHVSCGSKFGSDFLIYDGPRSERHAFAGIRIVAPEQSQSQELPVLSAYNLAAYVRCLNTANKLALLATVVKDTVKVQNEYQILYRIAFVDVALEKILSAPTHQKYGRTEKRRDVSKNLAKRSSVD